MSFSLQALKDQGLYREFRTIESHQGASFVHQGKTYLNFGSNNYLNLAQHPEIAQAMSQAAQEWGVGAQASRYVCGNHWLHDAFEEELSSWLQAEAALLCNTGYMANMAAITSLVGSKDLVLMDRSCHASIIDGVKLSGAAYKVFRHNDVEHLQQCLQRYSPQHECTLVIVEAIYSMDGDRAPLAEMAKLKQETSFVWMVDEAHALGVVGSKGIGLSDEDNVLECVDVRVATLGKAVGVSGGAIVAKQSLIDWIRNHARTSIYSTAMPLPVVAALRQAIELVQAADDARAHLQALWQALSGQSPVVPIGVEGGNDAVLALSEKLWQRGIFAPAMRFPTVPKGQERLRVSLTSAHHLDDVRRLRESAI